jgi:hypothetical protein
MARVAAVRRRIWPQATVVLDCKGGADSRQVADRVRRVLRSAGARSAAIWPDEAGLSLWQLPRSPSDARPAAKRFTAAQMRYGVPCLNVTIASRSPNACQGQSSQRSGHHPISLATLCALIVCHGVPMVTLVRESDHHSVGAVSTSAQHRSDAVDVTGLAVSASGSGMGAAMRWQVQSDAVIVALSMSLNCGNVLQQRLCRLAHSVRIEVLVGSGLRGLPRAWPSRAQRPLLLRRTAEETARHKPTCRTRRGVF